jgi:hypothetical protein
MKSFTIELPFDATLTEAEIWPDGDAPENPTVEDVKAVLKDCGPPMRVINDWGLMPMSWEFEVYEN